MLSKKFDRDEICCIDKCCGTIPYISFVFVVRAQLGTNVGGKCPVRLTTERHNNMQQCTTECLTDVACCIRKVELV